MMDSRKQLHPQELKRQRSLLIGSYIAATVPIYEIRQKCLSNIVRWRANGTNSGLWDDWVKLLIGGADQDVIAALTNDIVEHWKDLRRAAPYAGLICNEIREYIFSQLLTDLPTLDDLAKFDELQKAYLQSK